ncbi:MAG: hypothetical protein IPM98_20755 [Lewinellaceae bacterium]|nr:hypothetical protein [Lewinellaceae bacterium]
MEQLHLSPGAIRLPWKPVGIALLILFAVLLTLYMLSLRSSRRLKRRIVGLAGENEALQELLDAGNAELDTLKQGPPASSDAVHAQPPAGFRMPILNPGLKFNIQPDFSLLYPAFNAWNTGETLRVLAVLDHAGTFGDFRQLSNAEPFPAWVFQLFTVGGALLKESHLPVTDDGQPDGKRIVAEIRTLLESGLEEPPNT